MNKTKLFPWKNTAGIVCLVLLTFISSAPASLIMTGAFQTNATSFTPTWTVAPSLISGMSPTAQTGNFTGEGNTPGVSALTDGAIGPVDSTLSIFAAGGPSAGQTLTYTLPIQPNGYDLTNITVYSGWANGGRVGQGYAVLYSTVAYPNNFVWLTNVSYSAGFTGNGPGYPISIQVQLSDSAGGVIASNVAAIQFVFNSPVAPADENSGSGYSEITVGGTPAATAAPTSTVYIMETNEMGTSPLTNTWTVPASDLILGMLPSSSTGNFNDDGNETVGLSVLTDGSTGVSGTKSTMVSCGGSIGSSLVYTLTNSVNGSDVTNVVVYSGWPDTGRDAQFYILSYSTVLAPTVFIPITTVFDCPNGNGGGNAQANQVTIFNPTGAPLAKNVYSLKFDFTSPGFASSFNNGWQGYSEIVVQGTNSSPLPGVGVGPVTFSPYPVVAAGTSVTASAAVIGPTPYYFQWLTDGGSGGALTNIPGATTSTNLVINTTGFAPGNYQYALFASNNTSSATSPVAVLTISQPNGIPGVIGVKFGFTGGYATSDAPYPADNAGVATGQLVAPSYQPLTAVANWNNLLANLPAGSASGPGGPIANAINTQWNIPNDSASNALSGVTLTPSGFDDGWFSGGTECADGRLLYDCWKFNTSNGQTDVNGNNYVTLTFNNLPASTYDVYLYLNDNNGNYWGDAQANSVIAIGPTIHEPATYGLNAADSDPCGANPELHTAAGFGNPANYVKMPYVVTSSGSIEITVVMDDRAGDFGISGVELVPSPDIVLEQDILPTYAQTVVGDQVVLTGEFSNTPPLNLQWQYVNGGVTNNVNTGVVNVTNNSVVTSTLTFNNVQVADSGTYQLKAVNANNSADYAVSSGAQLLVSNAPVAVNGIIMDYAAQVTGGGNFYPAWTFNASADLVLGFPDDSGVGTPGTVDAGPGNFGIDGTVGDPAILTDGVLGNSKTLMDSCGEAGGDGPGEYLIYYLVTNSAPYGFNLTNIQVYGGWTDAGRRDQNYEVLYSTVSNTNLVPLFTSEFLPNDASGAPIATRTMLIPTNGVLASNVAVVEIDWNITPQYLNDWAGYSEIVISGTPSAPPLPTPPTFEQLYISSGNLILMGTNGTPDAGYTLLTTTNLSPPIIWTTNNTGTLDGTGAFSNAIPINPSQPQSFFRLRMP